ncbi:radical SAM family heme chaperone HemW [Zhouia sp. PK063]|uniref:radical SAM family heme chaperone HemW n=1 Tax=Zhouia sp. PK063 TaxID=3373602 RepID=UPI00379BB3E3
MGGIYIHIPFCKQACFYCDFHFSTSLKKKDDMLTALHTEIALRKNEFADETVETIYFGGGTPSILSATEINALITTVYQNYSVVTHPEITLEANPDDLSEKHIKIIASSKINRLSIGIQSFFEDDLVLMNRAHNALEAKNCLHIATQYFSNISIDLIYGIPNMSVEKWQQNLQTALSFHVPHISSYALTVEPKTALETFIKKGIIAPTDDALAQKHFEVLVNTLQQHHFVHYELSNFGKEGFFSKNNTAYWLGKKYIGIGPSAHSYNGFQRSWNIANNPMYIKKILQHELPNEIETLSKTDRYNEYIMTGLRTIWGVSLDRITQEFGHNFTTYALQQADKFLKDDLLTVENQTLKTTKKGKFLADGIASDLFLVNLKESQR